MVVGGLPNISEKETKRNEVLAKDLVVFKKDLVLVITQIREKKKELDEVAQQIIRAQEDLKKIQAAKDPLNLDLDKRRVELEKQIHNLSLQEKGWQTRIQEDREQFEADMDKRSRDINVKMSVSTAIEAAINELENRIKQTKSQCDNYTLRLGVITNDIRESEKRLKHIELREKAKEKLEDEISALKRDKKYLLAEGLQLSKFSRELDKRQDFLENKISEVLLLEERLKPKYIKAFGKYANI